MHFFVDCIPPKSTAQAGSCILKRNDGTQFIGKMEGGKSALAQTELLLLFLQFKPKTPMQGPLYLSTIWEYPWRKSERKKDLKYLYQWMPTRPDCSNLIKMVEDNMTRLGFWGNDAQIVQLVVGKRRGWNPGITVDVREITEEPPMR